MSSNTLLRGASDRWPVGVNQAALGRGEREAVRRLGLRRRRRFELGLQAHQDVDHRGVERRAGFLSQGFERRFRRQRRVQRPLRSERVEEVDRRQDPRAERESVRRSGPSGYPLPSHRSWWQRTSGTTG